MRACHLVLLSFLILGLTVACGGGDEGPGKDAVPSSGGQSSGGQSTGAGGGGSGGQAIPATGGLTAGVGGGSASIGGEAATGGGLSGGNEGSGASPTGDGGQLSAGTVAWVVEPSFVQNDNPAVPQAGVLSFATDVAAEATVTVAGGDEQWELSLPAATNFEKPIVGLLAETEYTVTLSVSAGDSVLTAGPLTWTTPALPGNLPTTEAVLSNPDQMEPGMTMFNARASSSEPLLIVDHQGRVRWYYVGAPAHSDQTLLPNGNFLFDSDDYCWIQEANILGDAVRSWRATAGPPTNCGAPEGSIPVDVDSFHHDIGMMPNGNLLGTSTEARFIDDFPASETNANSTERRLVMAGVIIEFTPEGEVEKRIKLLDVIDPTRIGRDSLSRLFGLQSAYQQDLGEEPADWDHVNSVVYDEASDGYIISMRNQDAVIKINRESEELVWILGDPRNWQEPWASKLLTPVGDDFQWQFHQHAPDVYSSGIALYDNGNYRAPAFETALTPEYSRAVIYSVDDEAMTVSQVWSYGDPSGDDSFFSPFMGDADVQPETGNMLMTNGQFQKPGGGGTYGSIFEVTADGTRIFELAVGLSGGGSTGIYRADRIADIRK